MKFYRIDFSEMEIVHCNQVFKKDNLQDFLLIGRFKSFVHINPKSLNLVAYLCKAHNQFQAQEKAICFLQRIKTRKS